MLPLNHPISTHVETEPLGMASADLHDQRRVLDGRVYSQRLKVQRLNKTATAAVEALPRPQPRQPPPKPASLGFGPAKTGRVQKKTGTQHPRRKTW